MTKSADRARQGLAGDIKSPVGSSDFVTSSTDEVRIALLPLSKQQERGSWKGSVMDRILAYPGAVPLTAWTIMCHEFVEEMRSEVYE